MHKSLPELDAKIGDIVRWEYGFFGFDILVTPDVLAHKEAAKPLWKLVYRPAISYSNKEERDTDPYLN